MKKLLILLCLLASFQTTWSQEGIIRTIRMRVDSALTRIEQQKDPDQRFITFLTIYDTPIEEYPLLLLEASQKLLQVARNIDDILGESNACSMAGQGYRLSGNYVKGLEYHQRAILLAEKIENKSVLGWAQNEMAHIYKDMEENQKAIALYKASIVNCRLGNNKEQAQWAIGNLAQVYSSINQLDSALYYNKLTLENFARLDDADIAFVYTTFGSVYSKMLDKKEAMHFFNLALKGTQKFKRIRVRVIIYETVAEHYYRFQQIDSCIWYSKKAIEDTQNSVFTRGFIKSAKLLTDIYQNINADSTIKYLKIYKAANDSLFSARANQQLQMMTLEEDQRQRDLAAEKINYQNKIKTNLMIAGLVVFFIIALILYRNSFQRKKANLVLQQQKDKVESTLAELRSTQTQLIQSEKMASLGELTAGIAHEIQNPLNFVNNFSEVSSELIKEMKSELATGNLQPATELADSINQNLDKIVHHGKRADTIVKSMMQHSRGASGQKVETDINQLCDEYLRLAYHGYRAKDKSFNAKFETDFDESIPKLKVVPQDISRVVLNLINNAFYAVHVKTQDLESHDYHPLVTVSTKNLGDKVEIRIKDNGNGIPDSVKEKIFQPFFTTKPTGQGTGLGLSLSYDIVKAHGGTIEVHSTNNMTEFSIRLPS